jgi:hypothetical protein
MKEKWAQNGNSLSSPRCVAVAYEWFLTPVDFRDYDIVLAVGCYDSAKSETWTRTYHARLPEKQSAGRQSDVSGNLGIIFPVSDDGAGKRAAASERLVADAIIWELAQLNFAQSDTLLLVQGPLLPKLRGRLLYRGLSENVTVWTLTWQPEWFWRLEAAEQLLLNIGKAAISPMYPPKGIDRASRCWVCRPAEKLVFHFEVLTNTWDCFAEEGWEKQCQQELASFIESVDLNSNEQPTLPHALALARGAARDQYILEKGFA